MTTHLIIAILWTILAFMEKGIESKLSMVIATLWLVTG